MTTEGYSLQSMEKYFYERNVNKIYSVLFAAGVYQGLNKALLSNALQKILAEFPHFSLNIVGTNAKEAKLVRVSSPVQFDDVVEYVERPELKGSKKFDAGISEEIMLRKFEFNTDKPLWKLLVINEETIVFYCDHIIFDGMSLANFHKMLLNEMNQVKEDATVVETLLDVNAEVRRTYDSFYKAEIVKPSWSTFAHTLWTEFAPEVAVKFVQSWFGEKSDLAGKFYEPKFRLRLERFQFGMEYINISPEIVNKLLAQGREQGVTMTASIIFKVAQSLTATITKDADIQVDFPINISKQYQIKDEPFGVYVTSGHFNIPAVSSSQSLDWNWIKRISSLIKKELDNVDLGSIGMLDYVNIKDWLLSKIGTHSTCTIQLSNLGFVDCKQYPKVNLVDMFFNQCIGFNPGLVALNLVTTPTNGMNISICYFEEDKDEILAFIDNFKLSLKNI